MLQITVRAKKKALWKLPARAEAPALRVMVAVKLKTGTSSHCLPQ